MAVSFQKLWESMESARKGGHHLDDKAMEAIRNGINVREDFWEDFMLVINNSGAMSVLLDVPVTKIGAWHQRVKEALDKVKAADTVPDPKDKSNLMKTGMPKEDDETDPKVTVLNQMGGEE
jgi:hypothetical protein